MYSHYIQLKTASDEYLVGCIYKYCVRLDVEKSTMMK